MDGIIVGIVGIEGKFGRGGRVTFGTVGMVGNVGMLRSGGRVPSLGNDDWMISNVGCGRFGIDGSGKVTLCKVGIGGKSGSWRR